MLLELQVEVTCRAKTSAMSSSSTSPQSALLGQLRSGVADTTLRLKQAEGELLRAETELQGARAAGHCDQGALGIRALSPLGVLPMRNTAIALCDACFGLLSR